MSRVITKNTVALYIIGELPPELRRQVEDAFDSNPMIQEWFQEADSLPDHVVAERLHADALDRFEAYRNELANESDRELFALAEAYGSSRHADLDGEDEADLDLDQAAAILKFVATPADERMKDHFADTLATVDLGDWGGQSCHERFSSFVPALGAFAGSSGSTPIPDAGFGLDGDHVFITCQDEKIPHGLCRIWLVHQKSRRVTLHLPRLESIDGYWFFRRKLLDILGREPEEQIVFEYLQPAEDKYYAFFDTDEVREFVGSLPADARQRKLAEEYLKSTSNSET